MEDKCFDEHCETCWPGESKRHQEEVVARLKSKGALDIKDVMIVKDYVVNVDKEIQHLREKIELHRSAAWQGQYQNLNVSMGEAMIRTIERETLDLVLKIAIEEYGEEDVGPFKHVIKLMYERDE